MATDVALELSDVCHAYGSRRVLAGVSLKVEKGNLVCLTGTSGCGKTTLLKIVAGIERPKAGRIYIDGKDASIVPTNEPDLGFVFQGDEALFSHLNVRQNVEFPFVRGHRKPPGGDPKIAVSNMLAETGLSEFEDASISALSGGLKQRVAIARALVYEPAILLLDEPLNSLDNPRKHHLIELLNQLKEKRRHTFLFVTHDDREIKQLADRVAVLDSGFIIQDGTIEELTSAPKQPIVTEILRPSVGDVSVRTAGSVI
jgi:ABC-type Fe3+/spermidine/putrescine transport system ATPase subunit